MAVGLLAKTFPRHMVDEVIEAAGVRERRQRMLPAWLTVYFVLALGLFIDVGAGRVMRKLAETLAWATRGITVAIPSEEALSSARIRLGAEPLRLLFERAAGFAAQPGAPGAFWRGLRLISLDSTVLNVQDTAANRDHFGWPPPGAGGEPHAFPRARLMVLAECSTQAMAAAVIGARSAGEADEAGLAQRMLPRLGPGMLVLAHIGVAGPRLTRLWLDAATGGAELLWRVGEADLPVDRLLADGTYLSHLSPPPRRRRGEDASDTTVRVIRYRAWGGTADAGEPVTIITTMLDPVSAPARELAGHYHNRWRLKAALAALRDDVNGVNGHLVLRSKTPDGANQEIWALLCAYHAIREMISAVAVLAHQDPVPIFILNPPGEANNGAAGQPVGFPPLTRWNRPSHPPRRRAGRFRPRQRRTTTPTAPSGRRAPARQAAVAIA